MTVLAPGVSLTAPPGWEVRVRRQAPVEVHRHGNLLVHAATVPLPRERGDFGSGVVTTLGADDVFVSLFEYDASSAGTALFTHRGIPLPAPSEFSPGAMQRPLPGQSGGQWFFTAGSRAWCLHVVLGSHARRVPSALKVQRLLSGLQIGAGS